MWTERAAKEWRQATRTWFLTLTFTPLSTTSSRRACGSVAASGGDLDTMKPAERLAEVLKDYRYEMDKYLMRLRSGVRGKGYDPVQFRYLFVPEPHKSGEIHFHMLLHEVSEDQPLTKRRMEDFWPFGHTSIKLVKDENAARYLTKYLGKHHFEGRLRASKFYGKRRWTRRPSWRSRRSRATGRAKPAAPIQQADFLADMRAEYGRAPGDEVDEIREGDPVPSCPTGLHHGVQCDCQVNGADPFGLENWRRPPSGVPEAEWFRRGWHEVRKGHPGPHPKHAKAGGNVH